MRLHEEHNALIWAGRHFPEPRVVVPGRHDEARPEARWVLRRKAGQGGLSERGRSASLVEEGKQALPVLAKPFGAVSSLIQSLIVEVILTVSWRERLGGDHRPPTDSAPRSRVALLGESCARHEGESGGEADERSGFEHWFFPL